MSARRVAAALAMLLALAGPATAAGVLGDVAFEEPPRLRGALRATTTDGALDLATLWDAEGAPRLTWEAAEVVVTERRGRETANGQWVGEAPETRTSSMGPGAFAAWSCDAACVVLLVARGEGTVGLSGTVDGTLMVTDAAETRTVRSASGDAVLTHALPARRIVLGAGGVGLADARASAAGELELVLWGARATLATPDGETQLASGQERAPVAVAGVVIAQDVRETLVRMTLRAAALDVAASAARLDAATLAWSLEGALGGAAATGWVELRGERTDFAHALFDAEGALHGAWSALDATGSARGARTPLGGDAARVRIDGATLHEERALPRAAPAVGAAVGLAALAVLLVALAKSGALVALYSRVARSDVLRHPTRAAVHAHVRDHPGAHLAEISRALRVPRVTLQHHLRMLVAHRLLVAQPTGRVLAFYAPGATPDASAVEVHVAMKGETRQRVVDALLAAPAGLTQRDLVEITGMSQRLLSYHLARLEELGIVSGVGARPRRFLVAPAHVPPPRADGAFP